MTRGVNDPYLLAPIEDRAVGQGVFHADRRPIEPGHDRRGRAGDEPRPVRARHRLGAAHETGLGLVNGHGGQRRPHQRGEATGVVRVCVRQHDQPDVGERVPDLLEASIHHAQASPGAGVYQQHAIRAGHGRDAGADGRELVDAWGHLHRPTQAQQAHRAPFLGGRSQLTTVAIAPRNPFAPLSRRRGSALGTGGPTSPA